MIGPIRMKLEEDSWAVVIRLVDAYGKLTSAAAISDDIYSASTRAPVSGLGIREDHDNTVSCRWSMLAED